MSIQSKFISFHKKIYLSQDSEDYKYAREKDDSITDEIKDKFKEKGYPVVESFIQGSLATYTAILEIVRKYSALLLHDSKDEF